ncbi:EfeM/EfeO family lipoprotein [Nocardioides mangrovi]|uniref:EfeM/EfeO family lipoprotein n=1 Tax=Nocardioides mangrovi TaxID=2874580 RepID=A0ABS7U713_9ACTN|nr:EfeM/EfeO family lipoprotein [Nocardioides mangrovi]MBZ5736680.1 EfeM/EfeO family lipoprotein [Nocardioides mangrovi]
MGSWWTRTTRHVALLGCVALALVALGPAVHGIGPRAHRILHRPTRGLRETADLGDDPVVELDASGCGSGWTGGAAGPVSLDLHNGGPATMDGYVEDLDDGRIYLDAEAVGPGASRPARVVLGAGRYRIVCASTETGSVAGPTVEVTGDYAGDTTVGVRPVTNADLVRPVIRYQHWVHGQLPRLQRRVRRLTQDLVHGDSRAARRDWLSAHWTYGTLGAAYDAFGRFDAAIDGQPTSGIPPPTDPDLHGFHQIEALLWSGRPTARIVPPARRLGRAVRDLRRHFGTDLVMAPIDIGLRAHEILEGALQREANGVADAGSHTELATVDANIAGTRQALRPLLPLLRSRDPRLADLQRSLDRLEATVRSHHAHGRWTPMSALGRTARERLDADLSRAVELLSDVAVITDPVMPMPGGAS